MIHADCSRYVTGAARGSSSIMLLLKELINRSTKYTIISAILPDIPCCIIDLSIASRKGGHDATAAAAARMTKLEEAMTTIDDVLLPPLPS